MCGIGGFFNADGVPYSSELSWAIVKSMRHRGPDNLGIRIGWRGAALTTEGVGEVSLCHARLSILDLSSAAHQPMSSQCNKVALAYNGEVYGFQALRSELNQSGYSFRTRSDTEVVLAAYMTWGESFVDRLDGMFAFAIWDGRDEPKLILARDRLGIKPLYFMVRGQRIAFASQPSALKSVPGFTPLLDRAALDAYLALRYVPEPLCAFHGVEKLGSATILVFDKSGARTRRYWEPTTRHIPLPPKSLDDCIIQVDHVLRGAVERHLVSDVPIGVFLSGGVDSTLVASYVANLRGSGFHTITIGFNDSSFDEAPHARKISGYLKSEHHEHYMSSEDVAGAIARLPKVYDEPFGDSSALPTMLVSELARRDVKVVLGGDGGDEMFYGYAWYPRFERFLRLSAQLPRWIKDALCRIPELNGRYETYRRVLSQPDAVATYMAFIDIFEGHRYSISGQPAGVEAVTSRLRQLLPREASDMVSALVIETQLKDDFLVKTDRASMGASLELRVPFLDNEVLDLSAVIPVRWKTHQGVSKYLLKSVLRRYVPEQLFDRPKKGFSVPIRQWLLNEFAGLVATAMSSKHWPFSDQLRREVSVLKTSNPTANGNTALRVWLLLVLWLWWEEYEIEGVSA
jgi:asparagine synthase (glutamine-hydrolysing)